MKNKKQTQQMMTRLFASLEEQQQTTIYSRGDAEVFSSMKTLLLFIVAICALGMVML